MKREPKRVHQLYRALLQAPCLAFPDVRERLEAPERHGVYIIYSPRGTVLHVGRTLRGKRGLRQRLKNHLHGASSFTVQFLDGKGSRLRLTHEFRYLAVSHARTRALLEAYAIGRLCPKHLGVGENAT